MKAGSHCYARGLSRSKRQCSKLVADRSLAHPSAARIEAGFALGRDHRDDDAALAPARQKRRGRSGLALGCLLVCALGGADADQGLGLAPDGSLCGRARGGAGVHWASHTMPRRRCAITPTSPGPMRRLGKAGIDAVNHLVVQEAHRFGFVDDGGLSADTPAQELPIGYPNEPGILRGLAQRCGRALTQLAKRGVQGLRQGSRAGADASCARSKNTICLPRAKADKRQVLTRILTRGGRVDGANASAYRASRDALRSG